MELEFIKFDHMPRKQYVHTPGFEGSIKLFVHADGGLATIMYVKLAETVIIVKMPMKMRVLCIVIANERFQSLVLFASL